jgi:S-adenosyl-L-methionine hydrolase (adenosine-forming)
MRLVALYTDFGIHDHYPGLVEAAFSSIHPDIRVVHISHSIAQGDIQTAAFLMQQALRTLPKATIHVCALAPQPGSYAHVFFEFQEHLFFGTDSGQFRLALGNQSLEAWDISHLPGGEGTFPSLDLFPRLCKALIEGQPVEEWQAPKVPLVDKTPRKPHKTEDSVIGAVSYIDSTGNTITNITRTHLKAAFPDSSDFQVEIRGKRHCIPRIYDRYAEVNEGELVAVFNSSGHLELAIYLGNMAELMGLEINSPIVVRPVEISSQSNAQIWQFPDTSAAT